MTAIVVDTSAIIAILRNEPEKDRFVDALLAANPRFMSAVSLQEAAMVIAGRLGDAAAREAFLRFGKGRHAASLNFGDCAAYALARANQLPLLFKGGDFGQTDIVAAVPAS